MNNQINDIRSNNFLKSSKSDGKSQLFSSVRVYWHQPISLNYHPLLSDPYKQGGFNSRGGGNSRIWVDTFRKREYIRNRIWTANTMPGHLKLHLGFRNPLIRTTIDAKRGAEMTPHKAKMNSLWSLMTTLANFEHNLPWLIRHISWAHSFFQVSESTWKIYTEIYIKFLYFVICKSHVEKIWSGARFQ